MGRASAAVAPWAYGADMAAADLGWIIGAIVGMVVAAWFGARRGGDHPADPDDPNAPDEHGFTPADKYGYGYDYSWGDPYGDKDL